ncbi:MAG: hypothetical protein PHC88_04700 [Terrimicrobiaceae bacterium]|nr:hypothetical protein [Terrimicrobiaceae bacterium]
MAIKSGDGAKSTIYEAEGQGAIVAYCSANKVTILAAMSGGDLQPLVEKVKPAGATTAQVEVPMYLRPLGQILLPPLLLAVADAKGETETTYDFIKEFDWAKEQQRAGIAVFYGALNTDGADGMITTAIWTGLWPRPKSASCRWR